MQPYQYFDAAAYFQAKLDAICDAMEIERYSVSNERKIDAANARIVVVSAMAGPVGVVTAEITYEISVYTNAPEEVMAMLTQLAKTETGKTFTSESEDPDGNVSIYQCVGNYMTPTIMERDVEIGPNHGVRVVQYARFGILSDLLDIKTITYKGETVEFAQATTNFVSQMATNNRSGQSLMKNVATGAAVSVTLTVALQRTSLCIDVIKTMHGARNKNSAFALTISYGDSDGLEYSGNYVVQSATINTVKGSVPSLQVSFVEYDL